MLMPKRTKFRKQQKGRVRGIAQRGYTLEFGEYGIKAVEQGFFTARQIEAARKAIASATKRGGKMWIRVFPDKPITKKPLEVRMGKGKGAVEYYLAIVRPGKVLFELSGVEPAVAKEAFRNAASKIPFRTIVISEEA